MTDPCPDNPSRCYLRDGPLRACTFAVDYVNEPFVHIRVCVSCQRPTDEIDATSSQQPTAPAS